MAFLTSITRAGLAAVIGLLSTGVSETLVSDALPVPPAVALARFDGIRAPDDASPGTPTASLAPLVTVSNATGQQFDRLGEALAKFAKVGLELPDLEVWFYGDKSDCDGRRGHNRSSADQHTREALACGIP